MLLSEDEQVSQAYKNGPLGSVPIDWEKTPFSELFVSFIEYTNDLDRFPLYSLTIEDGVTAKTERYERSHLVKKKNLYKVVRPNDFVYNPMNVRFGAIARYKGSSPVAVSGYYDVFSSVHESDSVFMENFLTFAPIISYYNKVSTGSLIEKQRVHFSKFLKFAFPLPSLQERKKIAAILSTQDKVIELKEKRLAQKEQQKKYLMQQLLTGKKRLPGFNEKWKVEKFSEIFDFLSTNTLSRDNLFEGVGAIQNIHYGDILTKFNEVIDLDCVCLPSIKESAIPNNCATVKSGDIIIADTAEDLTAGKAVEVQNIGDRVIYSGLHTMLCRPKEQLFSDGWLGFYMNSEAYHKQLIPYIAGVKVMAISKSNIVKTYIAIPSKAEQAAIVEILSTADHEIDLLQKSIEAEKQKKKSLMQLLLTGKVRVK